MEMIEMRNNNKTKETQIITSHFHIYIFILTVLDLRQQLDAKTQEIIGV
jgi:hypothetical protein